MKRMSGLVVIALVIAGTSACTAYREASLSKDTDYSASTETFEQIPFGDLEKLGITKGKTAFVVVVNVGERPDIIVDKESVVDLPPDKLTGRSLSVLPQNLGFFATKASPECETMISPDGTYVTVCP